MRSHRHVRRQLLQIEESLSQDRQLLDAFSSASWPDRRRATPWYDLIGHPTSFWRAWLATIALQAGVAAGCAAAASTQQVILVVTVLATFPLSLTPLVAWSRAHTEPEDRWC